MSTEINDFLILKKTYKDNIFLLGKDLLGFRDMTMKFHYDKICKKIVEPRKKPIRLYLVPRGFLKTTILTITQSIWLQLRNPSIRIAIISAVLANAKSMVTAIGLPYLANQRFRLFFSEFCPKKPQAPDTKWTNSEIEVPNRYGHDDYPVMESTFEAFGADSTLTSRHFDYLIVDDLVTRENSTTKDQMDKVKDFWKAIFPLRNDPKTPIDVVGTRWDDYDLYGDLEKDEDIEVIKFSAGLTTGIPLWPERYSIEELKKIKSGPKMGSYLFSCHTEDTLLLTSDFKSKKIKDITVGDEVIGFKSEYSDGYKIVNRLFPSKVKFVNKRKSKTIKITTRSSRILYCTDDHEWYTGRNPNDFQYTTTNNKSYRKEYAPAKVGGNLIFYIDPLIDEPTKEQRDIALWLGGIYDGEGHCKEGSIYISQHFLRNRDTYNAIEKALILLDFDFGCDCNGFHINGGLQAKRKFVLWCNPVKKNGIYNSMYKFTGRSKTRIKDRIISIERHIECDVYNIQTETGNYIAGGYMSKNCLYEMDPIPQEDAVFKNSYFRYFHLKPDRKQLEREDGEVIEINRCYMAVDGATEEGKNDYSCIMVGSMDHKQYIYILDYLIKQLDPADLLDLMYEYYEKWWCVEYAGQKAVVEKMLQSFMRKKLREEKKYMSFHPLGKNTTQNKEWLIKQLQPWYEGGYIWHNKTMQDGLLENQLIRFPKANNDDGPDTEQMLLEILIPSSKKIVTQNLDRNALEMWKRRLKRAFGGTNFNDPAQHLIDERTY